MTPLLVEEMARFGSAIPVFLATVCGCGTEGAVQPPAPPPPQPKNHYVSPSGLSMGDGSDGRPWNLTTALTGANGQVHPGDTIWLRGGTYRGEFVSRLNGAASNFIVVRQYQGERATIDGNLVVYGSYSTFWGFEIMRSSPTSLPDFVGINHRSTGSRYVNLVVHDASASGVGFWSSGLGGELYGCIIYNNGQHLNLDHGVYFNSSTASDPVKYVTDNIVFNNWAYGLHGYSPIPGELANLYLDGNVTFGNGTIAVPVHSPANILVGGSAARGIRVTDNYTYEIVSSGNWAARIGVYTSTNDDVVVTENTFVKYVEFGPWNTATVSGNTFYATANVLSTPAAVGGFGWSSNIHYRDPSAAAWRSDASSYSFADWKSASGLGPSDQVPGTRPSGIRIVVRPNKYELGRANIIVYNWDRLPTVSVDVSAVLRVGDNYEVRNVQDFYGAPVVSGIYGGGPLTLPMAGIAPPVPLGRSFTPAPVTGPEFNVFVVLRTES